MTPASTAVYAGLLLMLTGTAGLLVPSRWRRGRSRRSAATLAAAGILLTAAAFVWPAGHFTATPERSRLDWFMPAWQFGERHTMYIEAPPDRVYRAVRAVSADEIPFFSLLTWIRRGGRSGPEQILNAPARKPLLDVATATSFAWLADDPPRELVVGTVIAVPPGRPPRELLTPGALRAGPPPGAVLAAMNFLIEPEGTHGSRVTTETRVRAGDASSARRFAIYWRIIHPGSALIRRMWLRAIANRALRP